MDAPNLTPLQRQLGRVSRRLFLQTFLDRIVWCWVGALVLASAWLLLQPVLIESAPPWLRWAVAGGLFGTATLLALVLTLRGAPSRLVAALELDAKFGLKERVTTSLTLTPEQARSSAGQALLADVSGRVAQLDVGTRFPVRLSWTAFLVPACMALFLVATQFEPLKTQARANTTDAASLTAEQKAIVDKKREDLKKQLREAQQPGRLKSEELKQLEQELERIANRPHDSKEQLSERVKEFSALQQEMRKQEKQLDERTRSLKQQLQQMEKLTGKSSQEGPAKDLQKALAEGKLSQAKDEIDKLVKKIQNKELTAKEQEQLQKQLADLQKKLERVAEMKEKERQLKEANLDPETLKREMAQLEKERKNLAELEKLADKLGQCQQCLKDGNLEEAAKMLKGAGDQMAMDEQGLEDLRKGLNRLQDAKDADSDTLRADNDPQFQDQDTNEPNDGGIGAGRRPLGPEQATRSFETRAKTEFDGKGQKIFDGYGQGQNYRKKSGTELLGEIEQASQEAPEAIEQQRVPRAAKDMVRGFYQNLAGNGKEPPKK